MNQLELCLAKITQNGGPLVVAKLKAQPKRKQLGLTVGWVEDLGVNVSLHRGHTTTISLEDLDRVSKYKWHKKHGFRAYGVLGNRQYHIGRYDTQEDAARAYNAWAIEHHGQFASLNRVL